MDRVKLRPLKCFILIMLSTYWKLIGVYTKDFLIIPPNLKYCKFWNFLMHQTSLGRINMSKSSVVYFRLFESLRDGGVYRDTLNTYPEHIPWHPDTPIFRQSFKLSILFDLEVEFFIFICSQFNEAGKGGGAFWTPWTLKILL